MPDPPQGSFAAATDMDAPGRHIMYRDIKVPGPYLLRMTVFYDGFSEAFTQIPTLEVVDVAFNYQYRIDLMDTSAPVESLEEGDVLATVLSTKYGDPQVLEPTLMTIDLSPWQGQTVRLRFAQVDNTGPLRAGVDDIYLELIK
jgi:hypothetical protein